MPEPQDAALAEELSPDALRGAAYPPGAALRGDPAHVYSVSDVLLHRPCGLPCIDHPNPLRPDLGCPASPPEENSVDQHTYSVSLSVTVRGQGGVDAAVSALAPALRDAASAGGMLHASLTVSDLHGVEEDGAGEAASS